MSELYPFLFEPVYKDYIWGGQRIAEQYDRDIDMPVCAESWEISDRPEGMSVVTNGTRKGQSLNQLVKDLGPSLLGAGRSADTFPLLIKIIDASRTLSVQVHPDNDNQHLTGGQPKTEMWYFLNSAPGASIYLGLKPGVTAERFKEAVDNESVEPLLHSMPAEPGQAVFVPGGTVHAIAEGCMILEVQQNSNTTYRVYDWGRMGHDGKPRELHQDEALKVIRWEYGPGELLKLSKKGNKDGTSIDKVHSCPWFNMDKLSLSTEYPVNDDTSTFDILFASKNSTELSWDNGSMTLTPGTSVLIPADSRRYRLSPISETSELLRINW